MSLSLEKSKYMHKCASLHWFVKRPLISFDCNSSYLHRTQLIHSFIYHVVNNADIMLFQRFIIENQYIIEINT